MAPNQTLINRKVELGLPSLPQFSSLEVWKAATAAPDPPRKDSPWSMLKVMAMPHPVAG